MLCGAELVAGRQPWDENSLTQVRGGVCNGYEPVICYEHRASLACDEVGWGNAL